MLLTRLAPPADQRGAHPDDHLLVPDRRDHRLAAVLRDRALQRVRQPRADAGDLARRHQPARRHRRRGPHQRAAAAAVRLPVLPGRRSGRGLAGPRDHDRADRRPHHRRPPRQAHELAAGLAVRGRHARATVSACVERVVPGGAAGRPSRDRSPDRRQAARREGRADRRRRGRPPDGALRHDPRRGPLPVPVVHEEEAPARGHPHPDVRPLLRDARLLEDSLRIDKRFGLTGSQWTAVAVATASAVALLWWALHPDPEAPSGGGPAPPEEPTAVDAGTDGDLDEPEPTGPATSSA